MTAKPKPAPKRKWWRWPEDKGKNAMSPWFVVLWRLLFWPFLMIGASMVWLTTLCMYGWDDARNFWRSL